ncbi:reverse transcriptase domain-containing protein [Tanacetum coccineum]
MVGRGRHPRNARRFTDRGSDVDQRDPRDIEIERLQQRIRDLEIQHEHPDEDTLSNPSNWDEEENPFGGQRIFDLRDIPEKLKVKLVAIKLRKSASLWWEHMKNQRVREGKSKVETWDKMKKLLRAKFLPINHRQEAFLEYHNFSQRTSSSVEDFIAEFDRLRMRCAVEEEEEQVIARFLGALRADIADVCQGLGHLIRKCSNKQLVIIMDDEAPVYDTKNEDGIVKETDELVYADQGEALVTQRVMNADVVKTGDDSSWLQNKYNTPCFRTMYDVNKVTIYF